MNKDSEEIVWHPEYDYIHEEINRLFDEERQKATQKGTDRKTKRTLRKNLQLIRIFLPERDFRFLEKHKPFKKLHNLGGIPVALIDDDNIRIDTEIINPRKRKRRTVIYVREEKG